MPVTLFAEQSGQERALKATPPDVRRARGSLDAAGGAPLGSVHLGLNLSYIRFSDDVADTSHTESGGYVGVLGYGRLFHGLYLGGEVGKAENVTLFSGDDVEFLPIELHAKYAFQAGSHFVLDVGGGLSHSDMEIKPGEEWNPGCTFYICPAPEPSRSNAQDGGRTDDWLLGGQLFGEMMFRMGLFSLGFNGKYRITESQRPEPHHRAATLPYRLVAVVVPRDAAEDTVRVVTSHQPKPTLLNHAVPGREGSTE